MGAILSTGRARIQMHESEAVCYQLSHGENCNLVPIIQPHLSEPVRELKPESMPTARVSGQRE